MPEQQNDNKNVKNGRSELLLPFSFLFRMCLFTYWYCKDSYFFKKCCTTGLKIFSAVCYNDDNFRHLKAENHRLLRF